MNLRLPKTAELSTSLNFAFRGWIAKVALVVSTLAAINFATRLLNVGISLTLMSMLQWYRDIAHGLIDLFLWFLPWRLSLMTKDAITLWIMLGGLVARTSTYLRSAEIESQVNLRHHYMGDPDAMASRRKRRELPMVAASAIVAWPVLVLNYIYRPYVYWARSFSSYFRVRTHSSEALSKFDRYRFDMRIVLAIYAVTLLGAVGSFFILNALLPSVR